MNPVGPSHFLPSPPQPTAGDASHALATLPVHGGLSCAELTDHSWRALWAVGINYQGSALPRAQLAATLLEALGLGTLVRRDAGEEVFRRHGMAAHCPLWGGDVDIEVRLSASGARWDISWVIVTPAATGAVIHLQGSELHAYAPPTAHGGPDPAVGGPSIWNQTPRILGQTAVGAHSQRGLLACAFERMPGAGLRVPAPIAAFRLQVRPQDQWSPSDDSLAGHFTAFDPRGIGPPWGHHAFEQPLETDGGMSDFTAPPFQAGKSPAPRRLRLDTLPVAPPHEGVYMAGGACTSLSQDDLDDASLGALKALTVSTDRRSWGPRAQLADVLLRAMKLNTLVSFDNTGLRYRGIGEAPLWGPIALEVILKRGNGELAIDRVTVTAANARVTRLSGPDLQLSAPDLNTNPAELSADLVSTALIHPACLETLTAIRDIPQALYTVQDRLLAQQVLTALEQPTWKVHPAWSSDRFPTYWQTIDAPGGATGTLVAQFGAKAASGHYHIVGVRLESGEQAFGLFLWVPLTSGRVTKGALEHATHTQVLQSLKVNRTLTPQQRTSYRQALLHLFFQLERINVNWSWIQTIPDQAEHRVVERFIARGISTGVLKSNTREAIRLVSGIELRSEMAQDAPGGLPQPWILIASG